MLSNKYRGNITAAFSADLCQAGMTVVPNLLLRYYKKMGLLDSEMMLIIQLLRLRSEEKVYMPSAATLAECLSCTENEIEQMLSSLQERKMLAVSPYFDWLTNQVKKGYDLEPLFEKLSDFWACARIKEIEVIKRAINHELKQEEQKQNLGELYHTFESEIGRPLSPIEAEKIGQWVEAVGALLVREALRRAVLMGKINFRYMDAIILEWQKNNLRTLADVDRYEMAFQNRRAQPAKKRLPVTGEVAPEVKRKKEIIESLYMN
ncbi:MAG: DnaD domain-containing protein [Bacillota bacterium]|uniref:DnaD domain-containing protein n=1 Tax=Desulfurispora thermophila TaxID=265470 RepID=UPI000375F8C0|nr:DnaD domain protein [Desulfurispora thermophila]